jgi:hypothetical protein
MKSKAVHTLSRVIPRRVDAVSAEMTGFVVLVYIQTNLHLEIVSLRVAPQGDEAISLTNQEGGLLREEPPRNGAFMQLLRCA